MLLSLDLSSLKEGDLLITFINLMSSGCLGFVGLLAIFQDFPIPQCMQSLFLYGKMKDKFEESAVLKYIQVPKSYFSYFYIWGTLLNINIWCFYILFMIGDFQWPSAVTSAIGYFQAGRTSQYDSPRLLLLQLLFTVHVSRRCYESLYVSIHASGRISVMHLIFGFALYSLTPLFLLYDAQPLQTNTVSLFSLFQSALDWRFLLGMMIFIYGNYHQFMSHLILRRLRTNRRSDSSGDYLLPRGDLFELVSCPHYLCELLIYLGLWIMAEFAMPVFVPGYFTFANHVLLALRSHQWYLQHFKNEYPASRKALIPFIL